MEMEAYLGWETNEQLLPTQGVSRGGSYLGPVLLALWPPWEHLIARGKLEVVLLWQQGQFHDIQSRLMRTLCTATGMFLKNDVSRPKGIYSKYPK